jgi:hypothetical protein
MIHVTELIIRLLKGTYIYDIELAFTPMKTQEFTELPPLAAK